MILKMTLYQALYIHKGHDYYIIKISLSLSLSPLILWGWQDIKI